MTDSEFTDRVLLILGAFPEKCLSLCGGADPGATLRQRVEAEAAAAVAETLEALPADKIPLWEELPADTEVVVTGNKGTVRLPPEVLRTGAVRMSGWVNPAERILPPGHWLKRAVAGEYAGVWATPERPLAFHGISGGKPCLEVYPCREGDTVAGGYYIPWPQAGSICRHLPPGAAGEAARIAAARITS